MKKIILTLLLVSFSQLSFATLYPVQWTPFTKVDYVIVSGVGDGVHGEFNDKDFIFIKLQAAVINPGNCQYTEHYYLVHHQYNDYHNQTYATLLAAAVSGKEVSLGISTQSCDNKFPTAYMVKIKSS